MWTSTEACLPKSTVRVPPGEAPRGDPRGEPAGDIIGDVSSLASRAAASSRLRTAAIEADAEVAVAEPVGRREPLGKVHLHSTPCHYERDGGGRPLPAMAEHVSVVSVNQRAQCPSCWSPANLRGLWALRAARPPERSNRVSVGHVCVTFHFP